ncbi:MAG TPA: 50S ribosomal protein L25 [Syntrophales bacterium]|nr:50S ribosomal protein L25 [Syntrophales bacterium]
MEVTELNARIREVAGKGYSRRFRSDGLIPAVFYGPGKETILLTVSIADLTNLRKKAENTFIKLIINDPVKRLEKLSILKELQIEPVSRRYIHADFYEISMDHKMTFDIPVHLSGKSIGVIEGGELHHLKRELKVSCLPAMRPEFIAVDISGLQIGNSFKVQDIAPIEGATILDTDDVVIATVSVMKVVKQATEETETETETETVESSAEPEAK